MHYRFPESPNGEITSICIKEFLSVTGNGKDNIRELIIREVGTIAVVQGGGEGLAELGFALALGEFVKGVELGTGTKPGRLRSILPWDEKVDQPEPLTFSNSLPH